MRRFILSRFPQRRFAFHWTIIKSGRSNHAVEAAFYFGGLDLMTGSFVIRRDADRSILSWVWSRGRLSHVSRVEALEF